VVPDRVSFDNVSLWFFLFELADALFFRSHREGIAFFHMLEISSNECFFNHEPRG
jgi:hypothetical protein